MKNLRSVSLSIIFLLALTGCSAISNSATAENQEACDVNQKFSEDLVTDFDLLPAMNEYMTNSEPISKPGLTNFRDSISLFEEFVSEVSTNSSDLRNIVSSNALRDSLIEVSASSNQLLQNLSAASTSFAKINHDDSDAQAVLTKEFHQINFSITSLYRNLESLLEVCASEEVKASQVQNEPFSYKASFPVAPSTKSDIGKCLLPDRTSGQTSMPGTIFVGFPATPGFIPLTGESTVLLLPVDWQDVQGDPDYINRGKEQAGLFSQYYRDVSNQKLNFTWRFTENWVRLPGTSEDYRVEGPFPHPKLIQDAVAAADPTVDFSNVSAVFLLLPEKQEVMYEGTQDHYLPGKPPITISTEGEILGYVASGKYFDEPGPRNLWSHWVHELAHFLNMPDLYDHAAQHEGKSIDIPIGPFSGFDMMSSQDGPSRTINSWSRFIMGWLDPQEIYCQNLDDFESSTFELNPIDNEINGHKAVFIRLSETTALVIESRRHTDYDVETYQSRDGVIVFTVDTTLGHGQGYLALQAPEGRSLVAAGTYGYERQLDAVLYEGDSVTYQGITVFVDEIGEKDRVSIIK